MVITLTSAPLFIRCMTTSGFSALASMAYIKGVLYFLSLRFTWASCWIKQSTTSIYPFSQAIIRAVFPSWGSSASTLAPVLIKIRIHSMTSDFLREVQLWTAWRRTRFRSLLWKASSPTSSIMFYKTSESQAFAAFSISFSLSLKFKTFFCCTLTLPANWGS